MSDSFPAQVWKKLSAINVGDKAKEKNRMTYLSWVWAWQKLMDNYPESTFDQPEIQSMPDGSLIVHVSVTVREGESGLSRKMYLPVMDNRNNAIPNPNAVQINKAYQRCLVKCLGMFGLGLYIYAGEDLPEQEAEKLKEEKIQKAIKKCKSRDELAEVWQSMTVEQRHNHSDEFQELVASFKEQEAAA